MFGLLDAPEIVIYGSDLAVPLMLLAAIAAVAISTKVPIAETTAAQYGEEESTVIPESVVCVKLFPAETVTDSLRTTLVPISLM